ncbi:hypothetical protein K2173_010399 [Erythroxylum novogranatense]|uniref:BLOC-1-related complex subunit 6 C-terminal helix domain-containing protein n=1 Tax=Erythroxylum novogranatense TaxID=1862640 RepID=A0AAV8TF89_9ROSI|nr:hypothetical protein K2173_010399 [Erythroxylum novogranatense]
MALEETNAPRQPSSHEASVYQAVNNMQNDERDESGIDSGVNQSQNLSGCSTSLYPEFEEDKNTELNPVLNRNEIFKALEVVERDSTAIAESFTSLFASLRLALSEATGNSVDHMNCFGDAAGHLQESVLDAATKGNRYINSCLRLNEEMKGMEALARKLKILRANVDALDTAINKLTRFQ